MNNIRHSICHSPRLNIGENNTAVNLALKNYFVIMDWNWNVDLFEVGFCLDLGLVMLGLGFLIICRLMGFQNNFFVLLLLWGL